VVATSSSPLERTGDTPGRSAGTLPVWTAVLLYRGDITNRTRFGH
jgi:hypothetical protein